MKKAIFLILLQTILMIQNSSGQNKAQAALYLTNYSFSATGNEIGYVKINPAQGGQLKNISLEGPSATIFNLSKDYKLTVRKEKLKPGINWYDVVLKVKTTEGEFTETFRIVKDEFIQNKVIAHRGAWKNTGATENSIGALQHAIKLGCAGSEFDVHMSSDSVLFVNHDPTVGDIAIEKTTAADLAALKLANGESLPTLAAYLQEGIKQNKTRLILEIKPSAISKERSLALARQVVQMVRKYKAQAWVDYISFDYDILKQVQQLDPAAKVAYLNGDVAPAKLAQDKFYGFDYNIKVLQKNEDWITEAQQHKLTVNAWTVNDPAIMDWLLAKKVDFITTNEPEILLQKVNKPAAR